MVTHSARGIQHKLLQRVTQRSESRTLAGVLVPAAPHHSVPARKQDIAYLLMPIAPGGS